jgi:predicted phosphodiesterase
LLSDVHGNLSALRACLDVLSGVDAYLCAGDVVGYGPHPNHCIELIATLPGGCVAGNHDLIAIDELSQEGIGELARETLAWTRTVLQPDSRAWLGALPRTITLGEIVVAHGSVDDPRRYVSSDRLAADELTQLESASPNARLLVLGHTHRSTAFGERSRRLMNGAAGTFGLSSDERWLVNPGAVGQSRERSVRARAAVLDLDTRQVIFYSVSYDVAATLRALRRAGLPESAAHLRPRRSGVRSALKRLFSARASLRA